MEFRTAFHELGLINKDRCLTIGAPGQESLPDCKEIFKKGTEYVMSLESDTVFQYGPMQGHFEFRKYLAELLTNQYRENVTMDNLMATGAATHGLYMVTSLLFETGAPVFVEDPTYFIALKILHGDLGMDLHSVPMLPGYSTDVDLLDKTLTDYRKCHPEVKVTKERPFWGMFYMVPTYNNPTGRCLEPEKCAALVAVARRHGVLVFCDDVYNLLHYGSEPPPRRLFSYDRASDPDYNGGHVLSNGTFTKIFSPGIRLGWLEAPPRISDIIKNSGYLLSGGGVNHYTSVVMAGALKQGLISAHIDKLKKIYSRNMSKVSKILKQNLPPSVKFFEPNGGFFIWVELPENIDAEDVLKLSADKYNVTFQIGSRCSPTGKCKNGIRIAISYYELDVLCDAVTDMCKAITEHTQTT